MRVVKVNQKVVKLAVRDHAVYAPASVAGILYPLLSPRSHGQRSDATFKFCARKKRGIKFRPRLLPWVTDVLRQHGYQVAWQRQRSCGPSFREIRPEASHLAASWPGLVESIMWALQHPHPGGILLNDKRHRVDIIEGFARMFPREQIQVIVRNGGAAERLAKQLSQRLRTRVTANDQYVGHRPRLHVDNIFSSRIFNPDKLRIVLVADEAAALSQVVLESAQLLTQSCIFALLPVARRFDPVDTLRLTTAFGVMIYNEAGEQLAGCHQLTNIAYPPERRPSDPLDRKRYYIWHNDKRNQRIAAEAQALLRGDQHALATYGLTPPSGPAVAGTAPSVAVLVEGVEHARSLAELLPDWPVISLHDCADEDPDLPHMLTLTQAIITMAAARHRGLTCEAMVVAHGTGHAWQPCYGGAVPYCAVPVVIDVADDFDDQARRDSAHRLERYADYCAPQRHLAKHSK